MNQIIERNWKLKNRKIEKSNNRKKRSIEKSKNRKIGKSEILTWGESNNFGLRIEFGLTDLGDLGGLGTW